MTSNSSTRSEERTSTGDVRRSTLPRSSQACTRIHVGSLFVSTKNDALVVLSTLNSGPSFIKCSLAREEIFRATMEPRSGFCAPPSLGGTVSPLLRGREWAGGTEGNAPR